MTREVPIKNLEEVHYATLDDGAQKLDLCHIYAIFRKEEVKGSMHIWHLFDEYKEIPIYLCGKLEEYPRPKPGDVVRVHRLRIDSKRKRPEISLGRNVVYWPAFQYEPKPVATAKHPTITEDDNIRRRVLETLYCSNLTRCLDILRSNDNDNYTWFQAVAGRVEENQLDRWEHHEIKFSDGTEPPTRPDQHRVLPTLRVFKPTAPDNASSHYEVAKILRRGQYFVATNVKLARNYHLHLSANEFFGRSLRLVEEASILGVKLKESIGEPETSEPAGSSQQASTSNGKHVPVRRSPRFNQNSNGSSQDSNQTASQTTTTTTTTTIELPTRSTTPVIHKAPSAAPKEDPSLQFNRFSEIKPKESGYDFYNLIGQVRGQPQLTKQFNNCVFQIFDGSRHSFATYYHDEFEQIIDGCLILYVYSKQKDQDTNEHFEKAMSLKPGDVIFARNVKVSLRYGRLRLELQANKLHNKSINLVDVDSPFGRKILDIVQTPQVEEIYTDEASDSSQELR